MRAEAQERLRAKFGNGGLKSQSVNNNGFGSISSSGSGGGGNSGAGLDEFLGVDLSASTAKLGALAGNVFGRVAEVAKVTGTKVAEGATIVTKKVQVRCWIDAACPSFCSQLSEAGGLYPEVLRYRCKVTALACAFGPPKK